MSKDTNKKEKSSKNEQKNSFMKDLNAELKKVTWPTSKELVTSTSTVLFIALVIAVIVFVLDFTFEKMNTYGIDKLKSTITSYEESDEEDSTDTDTVDDSENTDVTTDEENVTSSETTDATEEDVVTTEETNETENVTE